MPRILVVDDERSIRTTVAEFLKDAGHYVDIAPDADAAMCLLRQPETYDVILTDVILPRISGVELLSQIRELSPETQVILMTGEPTAETAAEAMRMGATDYLMKPVSKDAVLRSVASAVRVKAMSDDRQRLLKANDEHQRNLEMLVKKRTEQLESSNARLQATLRELRDTQQKVIRQERLNALGQMASGIAHDFNNVLMPILGLSGFFISHPELLDDKEETTRALESIHSAARDAREIVRRLREIYKPHDSLDVTPVRLEDLVAQCITLTEPAWHPQAEAEGRTIVIESNVSDLPDLMLNAAQIRETLTNLILNAVDAMPTGGSIRIDGRSDGNSVFLTVTDTGVGMPPTTAARCLEPFFTTKGEHGTGLGLALCHGIVQRHGGTLDIQSTKGVGTIVSLCFPVPSDATLKIAPALTPSPASVPHFRVLVVDDEAASRHLISQYLTSQGHSVDCVSDGREALERLGHGKFDLLLTDRAMPGMGGDEVAREAHRIAPQVPVVLLTGFGDIMNHRNELPDGVTLVAAKPITSEELGAIVSKLATAKEFHNENR